MNAAPTRWHWFRCKHLDLLADVVPPERVAEVIDQALTAPRPKTRYLVGRDALITAHIIAHLPDRLRDRLMAMR